MSTTIVQKNKVSSNMKKMRSLEEVGFENDGVGLNWGGARWRVVLYVLCFILFLGELLSKHLNLFSWKNM